MTDTATLLPALTNNQPSPDSERVIVGITDLFGVADTMQSDIVLTLAPALTQDSHNTTNDL